MSDNSASFDKLKADMTAEIARQRDTRSEMTFESVFAMAAGIIMAVGLLALAVQNSGDSGSGLFVWSVVGIAGAYAAVKYLGDVLQPGAVTLVLPLVVIGGAYITKGSLGDGKVGLPMILIGAILAAMWVLPVLRGRPALLATSLFFLGSGLVTLLNQSSITNDVCYSYDGYEYCESDPGTILESSVSNSSTIALILGVAMLIVAFNLDKKGWPNVAKPFIGVGIVFEVLGLFGVVSEQNDPTLASLMVLGSGALLVAVGLRRSRRATLIIGALAFSGGVIGLLANWFLDGADTATTFGIVCALVAAAIGYGVARKSNDIKTKLNIG